jgi:uncharacterized protein
MPGLSKQEADAYDSILEAAAGLADLIETAEIEINEYDLEELTIHLAKHAHEVKKILRPLRRRL